MAIGVLLIAPVRAQDDRDLDVLLDRLSVYLHRDETQLSTLLADEHYVQEERVASPEAAENEAEVLFLRLPGEAEGFGVRDVNSVDGQPPS